MSFAPANDVLPGGQYITNEIAFCFLRRRQWQKTKPCWKYVFLNSCIFVVANAWNTFLSFDSYHKRDLSRYFI